MIIHNRKLQANLVATEVNSISMDINDAHNIFNHTSEKLTRYICRQNGINTTGTLNPCEACIHYKQKRNPTPQSTDKRATMPMLQTEMGITYAVDVKPMNIQNPWNGEGSMIGCKYDNI